MEEQIELNVCYNDNYVETYFVDKKNLDRLKKEFKDVYSNSFSIKDIIFSKCDITSVTIENIAVQFYFPENQRQ